MAIFLANLRLVNSTLNQRQMKTKQLFKKTAMAAMTIGILMACAPQSAMAQDRFSFEFRPGVNFPVRELGDADLKTGFGFEGVFAYQFLTHFGVYGGWGWNRFNAKQSFAGPDVDFEETGYTYGLQYMHAIGQSNVSLLARAGILSNHIEVEDSEGDIIGDSGHGFSEGIGWQVEGRVAWVLGDNWYVIPSIRYRSLPRDIKIGAANTEVVLSYLSVGVGISWIF